MNLKRLFSAVTIAIAGVLSSGCTSLKNINPVPDVLRTDGLFGYRGVNSALVGKGCITEAALKDWQSKGGEGIHMEALKKFMESPSHTRTGVIKSAKVSDKQVEEYAKWVRSSHINDSLKRCEDPIDVRSSAAASPAAPAAASSQAQTSRPAGSQVQSSSDPKALIRQYQSALNNRGCGPLVEDGIVGPKYQAAMDRWKKENPDTIGDITPGIILSGDPCTFGPK